MTIETLRNKIFPVTKEYPIKKVPCLAPGQKEQIARAAMQISFWNSLHPFLY